MMRLHVIVLKDEGVASLQSELVRKMWEATGATVEIVGDGPSPDAAAWQVTSYVAHSVSTKLAAFSGSAEELRIFWHGRVVPLDTRLFLESCLGASENQMVWPPSASFGQAAIVVSKPGDVTGVIGATFRHLASSNLSLLLDAPTDSAEIPRAAWLAFEDCKLYQHRPWLSATAPANEPWMEKLRDVFSREQIIATFETDLAQHRVRPSLLAHIETGEFPSRNARFMDDVNLTAERVLSDENLALVQSDQFYWQMVRYRKKILKFLRPLTLRRFVFVFYHYLVHPRLGMRRIGLRLARGI